MEDKYKITIEENIFVAKRNIIAINNLKHARRLVIFSCVYTIKRV